MSSSADSGPSTSGRGPAPYAIWQPAHAPSTTTLALTIAGAAVAGAVVWHFTREFYYAYVPPKVGPWRGGEGPQIRGRQGGGRRAAAANPAVPPRSPPPPPRAPLPPACCTAPPAVPVPARHDDGLDGQRAGAARQASALPPPRARLP